MLPCTASTLATYSFSHFFPRKPRISKGGNRSHHFVLRAASRAENGDESISSSSRDRQSSHGKFDRRDVLIGLGSLYCAGNLYNDPFAIAAPVSRLFPSEHVDVALAAETPASVKFPVVLEKAISTVVPRPRKSRSKKEKEDEEEVLVIDGIELEKDAAVKFDVYIDDEEDSPSGPDNTEFAGSFVNLPDKSTQSKKKKKKTSLKLGITDLLEDLKVEDDDSVVVTLVPRYGEGLATIGGIKIDFLS